MHKPEIEVSQLEPEVKVEPISEVAPVNSTPELTMDELKINTAQYLRRFSNQMDNIDFEGHKNSEDHKPIQEQLAELTDQIQTFEEKQVHL